MRANKLVFMKGFKYDQSPFGGIGDIGSVDTAKGDNQATIVGTAAGDNAIAVNNPFTTFDQYPIFAKSLLSAKVGVRKAPAFTSAWIAEDGTGKGLAGAVDPDGLDYGSSQYQSDDGTVFGKVGAFLGNIVNVIKNFIKSKISGEDYQSIYTTTFDGTNTGSSSTEEASTTTDSLGNGRGRRGRRRRSVGYGNILSDLLLGTTSSSSS